MPRLHTAGHQIIPRALGRGFDEHRSLDLHKMQLVVIIPHHLGNFGAHHDGLVHGGAAQIQIAVFQAQLVVDIDAVAHLKGSCLRAAEHAQLGDEQFHLARGDLVRFRLALTQRARGNNDILAFQAGGLFKHGPVRGIVKNKLQDACGVPQVRKNNAALVAAFCDGAGHRHLCARVPGAQRPAIVGTAQVSHCFHKNHPFRRFASAQIQEQTPAPRHAKQNWRGIRQRPRDTTAQRPLSITV